MQRYNPKTIEQKWQKIWDETNLYETPQEPSNNTYYCLAMFPYPSGNLHVGHWYNFGPADTIARFHRMQGRDVLHPMGFDAFGLPAENAAIKRNIAPAEWTASNIEYMTKQLKRIGTMYDWDREVNTSQPDYYRWNQWLFLKLYEHGLAYRKNATVNWCPSCQTVLANEQVVGDANECERCGTPVIQKELEQWYFKITDYADRLLDDLDNIDWPGRVKTMQQNWIGRKYGIDITYDVDGVDEKITVFTTRPDTNFGATFIVLAPEHDFVKKIADGAIRPHSESRAAEVVEYVQKSLSKTELERQEEGRIKTGAFTGFYAINKLNGEKMPIWVSDFVLAGFGTGAVVGVPGHDMRDYQFATTFGIPIKRVVVGPDGDDSPINESRQVQEKAGTMINSDFLNGIEINDAIAKMMDHLEEKGWGERKKTYRLRDWLISRQRYWGTPIPIVYCKKCGEVPVPYDQLPVLLPRDVEFEPTGQSPLLKDDEFVNTACPMCEGPAKRETDTMDTFVCSSWYFLRYPNTQYTEGPFDMEAVKKWLPVDHYIGGIEHAILHLLYARFVVKVLHDHENLPFKEPFKKLTNQGIILGPDGQKMSKSRGNVVDPDDQVDSYGADTLRMYLMFMGPYEHGGPYDFGGIGGVRRFLDRFWNIAMEYHGAVSDGAERNAELETRLAVIVHKTLKKVSGDLESMGFNTAIAAMMEMLNQLYRLRDKLPFTMAPEAWREAFALTIPMLAPFAPHMSEELWHTLGLSDQSVHIQRWPVWDDELIQEAITTIVVQINGKVRANLQMQAGADEAQVNARAHEDTNVSRHLEGKEVLKTIFVADRLINFVVRN